MQDLICWPAEVAQSTLVECSVLYSSLILSESHPKFYNLMWDLLQIPISPLTWVICCDASYLVVQWWSQRGGLSQEPIPLLHLEVAKHSLNPFPIVVHYIYPHACLQLEKKKKRKALPQSMRKGRNRSLLVSLFKYP